MTAGIGEPAAFFFLLVGKAFPEFNPVLARFWFLFRWINNRTTWVSFLAQFDGDGGGWRVGRHVLAAVLAFEHFWQPWVR